MKQILMVMAVALMAMMGAQTAFAQVVNTDPAAQTVQDEAQKGMVIDVTQTGYLLNGKVLRYAKVVVGA